MLSRFIYHRLSGTANPFQSPYNDSGKGGGSDTPDLGPIADAQKMASERAYKAASEDLAFRKQVYADQKPAQQDLASKASTIADQQIGLSDIAQQRSEQQWQDYGNTYRPTEQVSALDAYGGRYLNESDNAQLQDLLTGGDVAGGTLAKPTAVAAGDYEALQQRIKGGGRSGMSDADIQEYLGLMQAQNKPGSWTYYGTRKVASAPDDLNGIGPVSVSAPTIHKSEKDVAKAVRDSIMGDHSLAAAFNRRTGRVPNLASMSDADVVAWADKQGLIGRGASAGLDTTQQSRLTELIKKQAAGPGAYQLTDEDRSVLDKYTADQAAYSEALNAYKKEQDGLRLAGLSSLTRRAEDAAATGAETRADADNASAFAQAQRSLSRLGGDPSKMAANAVGLANTQALNRANAGNVAREQAADKLAAMRAGTVATGRNQVNTAGQNIGLSTGAGSSAVQNQNTGFMSALPYAQYQSGATGEMLSAAQLQQQGALGLGSLMNQQASIANQNQGGGALGAGLGMIGTLGSAWIKSSDRRLKTDIVFVGRGPGGLNLYEFAYLDAPNKRYRGVMADEVEAVFPAAVVVGEDGYKKVNYELLGMQMVEI